MNNDREFTKADALREAEARLLRERFGDGATTTYSVPHTPSLRNRLERRRADAIERAAGRKLSLKERIAAGHVWNP
jgi:hypothetical protein